MSEAGDPIRDAAGKLARSFAASLAFAIPILLLVQLGAPEWVSTTLLVAAVLVLGLLVVRERRRR